MQPSATHLEYIILCLCLCLGVLSTALASPLYSIYMENWHISTTEIGYAFIAYMVGVVFSLLFLNGLSAKYGYKKTVMAGLVISILSLAYSALANNIVHLCAARFFIGISSGLLSTATIIGLTHKYPFKRKENAGKISSIITVFGFGLGPLVGGILADHSQSPLTTPYWIIAAISSVALCACPLIRYRHIPLTASKPASIWNIPTSLLNKQIFFTCAMTAVCCFGMFSLYAALAGTFIKALPVAQSATLTGFSISIILFISTFTQLVCKGLKEATSMTFGLCLTIFGCMSLMLAQYTHLNIWLISSILAVGIGHGLCLSPAYYLVGLMTQKEPPAIFSTFLLLGYQGTIWPVLLSSILIDHFGIMTSLAVFSVLIFIAAVWILSHLQSIKHNALSTTKA